MGVLYKGFDDDKLLRKVTPALREQVIQNYYRSHHNALTLAVQTQLDLEEVCLILNYHSFPSTPLLKGLDQSTNTASFRYTTQATFH